VDFIKKYYIADIYWKNVASMIHLYLHCIAMMLYQVKLLDKIMGNILTIHIICQSLIHYSVLVYDIIKLSRNNFQVCGDI